jgi:hypothetical protein
MRKVVSEPGKFGYYAVVFFSTRDKPRLYDQVQKLHGTCHDIGASFFLMRCFYVSERIIGIGMLPLSCFRDLEVGLTFVTNIGMPPKLPVVIEANPQSDVESVSLFIGRYCWTTYHGTRRC